MKRSQMVLIIAESLIEPHYPDDPEKEASCILRRLERYGMLPPGYMKPIPIESNGKQYPLVPGDFQNDNNIWCTPGVNEWEPEDETI